MMQLSDQKLNRIIKILLVILLALASIYIFSQFTGFINAIRNAVSAVLTPFVLAFFINFLIFPVVRFAEDKGVRPRWLIVGIIYLIIFGLLAIFIYWVGPKVVTELKDLFTDKIPKIVDNITKRISGLDFENSPTIMNIIDKTQSGIESYLIIAVTAITTSIPGIIDWIFTIVLTPIILFYFLKDHSEIGEGIYKAVPAKLQHHFIELVKKVNDTLGLYIRGQVIIMFGIGTIATLGYTLIKLDYAILFGVIVGLTNIIPYIGATIAAIFPVGYSLLAGGVEWYYVMSLNIAFQFVEGNILQPVIMSKQLDLHPLIIIASILGFGSLLGVVGIIFAVPLAGFIKVLILYIKEVREKKVKEGYEV
ncbi:MAG: hypothetical protein K0Q49_1459 [Haloplasmataceae bacterium]|jgi:putative permease|nr:hypothetical protein [Haloplasmataceae bacterium]